jgi:hypothetical protein
MAYANVIRIVLPLTALLLCVPALASAQAWSDFSTAELRGPSADGDTPETGEEPDKKPDEEPEGEVDPEKPWQGRNAFEVWEEEHRWFRLGMRAYGYNPTVQEHAALKLGAGLSIPLTTDFFMGLGMKIAFTGSYNRGAPDNCVDRGGSSGSALCPSGHPGGVDYTWREPLWTNSEGVEVVDGSKPADQTTPSTTIFMDPQRRATHVAYYSLTIGGNYELSIPNLQFFRVFQPFFGGGVVIAWVYVYSDITDQEYVLIDNAENDALDDDNIDPWSDQGPEVGGEVYGGFHLNLDEVFRFTFEVGYHNIEVPAALLNKSTEGFDAKHLDFRLAQLRFGGGFEFRF